MSRITQRVMEDLSPPIILTRTFVRHILIAQDLNFGSANGFYFLNGMDNGELGVGTSITPVEDLFYDSRNPMWALQAARKMGTSTILPNASNTGRNAGCYKLLQCDWKQKIKVQNANNWQVELEWWLCQCRRDQPKSDNSANESDFVYPLRMLRRGFQQNNIDAADFSSGNEGMVNPMITPFQSKTFCQNYKIKFHGSKIMSPGQTLTFNLNDERKHFIDLNRYQLPLNIGDTFDPALVSAEKTMYIHIRGEQFYLFRYRTYQLGENTGTSQVASASPNMICSTEIQAEYKPAYFNIVPQYQNLTQIGFNAASTVERINQETDEVAAEANL